MTDAPRLFLITPPLAVADAFAPLLKAAVGTADVACLLIRTATREEHGLEAIVRALAPIAQARDVAVLVEDPRLAARLDVDGVHVDCTNGEGGTGEALGHALSALKPRKIVGAGALAGRDAAMSAGERGVDYVMFGWPGGPESAETIRESVAWWADIFNVPCVGYASHPDLAGDVAQAGAEFVGLCDGLWDDPDKIATLLRDVQDAITPMVAR